MNSSLSRCFSLIRVWAKVWKFVHHQIVNQARLDKTKHQLIPDTIMCFNCSQTPATKKCLCCDELNACKYSKIRRLYIYLLTTLPIFFIKLINEHASINLILIRNTKRQKGFFRVLFCFLRLYLVSQFLYFMIHTSLFETNL